MKKVLLFTLSVLICFSVYAQNNDLLLFKLPDKKQTIKIKPGAWISLQQKISFTPDSLRISNSITGKLNFAGTDSINMMVNEIRTYYEMDSSITKQIVISGKGWPFETYKSDSYPISDISMLRYQNKSGHVFSEIGKYICLASIITVAVVAPLVSIDYKNSTFNMDTYKSVMIAGTVGIGISIPILILSQKKYIHLEGGKTKHTRKVYTHIRPLD